MKTTKEILLRGIQKYKSGHYTEKEIHSTLETVISLVTEFHFSKLREGLEKIESELERIDFLFYRQANFIFKTD